jgi:hypothetical protein
MFMTDHVACIAKIKAGAEVFFIPEAISDGEFVLKQQASRGEIRAARIAETLMNIPRTTARK